MDFNDVSRPPPKGELSAAAEENDVAKLRLLLHAGADINEQEMVWQQTPLVRAVSSNALDAAQFLVEAGADMELPNCNGCTPLMLAVLNGRRNMARILLDAGASLSARHNNTDVAGVAKAVRDKEMYVAYGETEHAAEIVEMIAAEAQKRAREMEAEALRLAHETTAKRQKALRQTSQKPRIR